MILKTKSFQKEVKNGLYLVSTPIGNLGDITFRAVEILKRSDYILCEDTRLSKNLFQNYSIQSKLIPNHKFNERKNLSKIMSLLKSGAIVSLVSDAGTPSISDPGAILIRECINNDISVTPLPGASAVTSALAVSGFSEKFFFYGFFPDKLKKIDEDLKILSQLDCSIIFFISPKKLTKLLIYSKKILMEEKLLFAENCQNFMKNLSEQM